MQKLSFSPFFLRRLDSSVDTLPFAIDDNLALAISNSTMEGLFAHGRLFYIDFRFLEHAERGPDEYGPSCDALFFQSYDEDDFLPLAIRTLETSLIYTPEDTFDDWMLAKMMFSVNDFFANAFQHLAGVHYVSELVYQAAVRTLSDEHPVLAILSRCTFDLLLLWGLLGRLLTSLVLNSTLRRIWHQIPCSGVTVQAWRLR